MIFRRSGLFDELLLACFVVATECSKFFPWISGFVEEVAETRRVSVIKYIGIINASYDKNISQLIRKNLAKRNQIRQVNLHGRRLRREDGMSGYKGTRNGVASLLLSCQKSVNLVIVGKRRILLPDSCDEIHAIGRSVAKVSHLHVDLVRQTASGFRIWQLIRLGTKMQVYQRYTVNANVGAQLVL